MARRYVLSVVFVLLITLPSTDFGNTPGVAGLNATGPTSPDTPRTPSIATLPSTPLSVPAEYRANSSYHPIDNIGVVAVRPDGKELFVYSYDPSDMILIVDIDSPDYPVIGKIQLPGRKVGHAYISF